MVTALKSFRPQLELYSRQARETTALRRAARHSADRPTKVVMSAAELDEFIALGLSLFHGLKQHSQTIQEQIEAGQLAYEREISEAFAAAWGQWSEPCRSVESAIRWFEAKGQPISNAEHFRECVRELKLQTSDFDALARADDNLRAGRGLSLQEALGGLQSHCRS